MADAILRHGDGSHLMRPDRVYRTSVLSPMVGYQPPADVNAVAMLFTQGPDRGMSLQGLGAMPGPIARWWASVKARIAQRKAEKLMSVSSGPPPFVPTGMHGLGMPGPEPVLATQISPHLATQMTGMLALMRDRYGQGFPAAQAQALVQRSLTAKGYR